MKKRQTSSRVIEVRQYCSYSWGKGTLGSGGL